ncbi:MAG: hypothetical protein QNJ54_13285 [Prochloraceae cyanobacterium]|nr:hypothetical protein [Prochloraceae cyanobacterium]
MQSALNVLKAILFESLLEALKRESRPRRTGLETHFFGQSHLTFCFRRATGVTPKVYQDI